MTPYETCQKIAKEHNQNCWEYFNCPTRCDPFFGITCRGNCDEILKQSERDKPHDPRD